MSARAAKAVVAVALVVVAGLYLYGFVLNRPEPGRGAANADPQRDARLHIAGATIQGLDDGVTAWIIEADSVWSGQRGDTTTIEGITHGEIMREGAPYLTFSADGGRYASRTGELVLSGGVQFWQGDRPMLRTDQVIWKPAESRAVAPNKVVITTGAGELTVDSLELDVSADKMYYAGDMLMIMADSGMGITVKGDNIVFDPVTESFESTGPTTIEFELEE